MYRTKNRTKNLCFVFGALAVLAFVLPEEAWGQPYAPVPPRPHQSRYGYRHRVHGYVGGQLMGMGIIRQRLEDGGVGYLGPGGGFGLFGGIRLGPYVALEANWTYTGHNESWEEHGSRVVGIDFLQIQTLTADFKFHIPTYGRFEPFVQAGAGFSFMGVTGCEYCSDYIFQSGGTWSLGGGGDFWLGPWLSLGGRLLYRGIYFTENEFGGSQKVDDNFIHGISFDFNAKIHF